MKKNGWFVGVIAILLASIMGILLATAHLCRIAIELFKIMRGGHQ